MREGDQKDVGRRQQQYRCQSGCFARDGRRPSSGPAYTQQIAKHSPREPLINEVGEWNRESCHLGFSD
ncbi:hypothetical protein CVV70_16965 [Ralstonia solanacearum]|nr:hypothetical protein B5G54_18890 [Ralstonia solanacearum]PNQ31602.1 hypothetical protein CVV71_23320 [Ralstonia solanacearum]PNQ31818.1 hypothetical protein CVS51_11150 [Ralstonia solanacearum]PNQ39434.1 hypothetical protein CVT21_16860 [Ralstonia solanacearum]PNQ48075.1 hypothetical protein CVV70_16965 [Ralstonia solanacearum]